MELYAIFWSISGFILIFSFISAYIADAKNWISIGLSLSGLGFFILGVLDYTGII